MGKRRTKKKKGRSARTAPTARDRRLGKMDQLIDKIVTGLPELDVRAIESVVKETQRDRSGAFKRLFKKFQAQDPGLQAVIPAILAKCRRSEVVDQMNLIILDDSKSDWVRARANDLLAEIGEPMDQDVYEMTVPGARDLAERLPSRVLALLDEGRVDQAVERFASLETPFRIVLMYRLVNERRAAALPFLERAVEEDEEAAHAAALVLARAALPESVDLLQKLSSGHGRQVQKAARRALFALRAAGVEVPEARPEPDEAPSSAPSNADLPLYRTLMSASEETTLGLAVVARERPDGWLRVLSVVADVYKGGILQASYHLDMSKSRFRRVFETPDPRYPAFEPRSLDECVRFIARGVRATHEFGASIPYDLQLGKSLIKDLDAEVERVGSPFRCRVCGGALDDAMVERIKALAPYETMTVDPICASCKDADQKTKDG